MAFKIKHVFILVFLPLIFSCASRKCCPDLFSWSKGKSPNAEYQYSFALSEDSKIYTLGGTNQGAFEMFDAHSNKWIDMMRLPTPLSFGSGVVFNNTIFVFGGIDTLNKYTDAVQSFNLNPRLNYWTTSSLTSKRSRTAAVVCDYKIYLIGGLAGNDDQSAVNSSLLELYDPTNDTWHKKAPMPTPRHGHSAISVNNKIIVAGGYTQEGQTSIVEQYDPVTDTWSRLADLPFPNAFFGLVTVNNTIYAFGGRLKMDAGPILKYDVNADQWSQVGSMPESRNRFGIAVDGRRVYIIGGEESPKSVWIGKKL